MRLTRSLYYTYRAQVPPDLRESFQNQLLQQDFSVGRGITCAVSKVKPTPTAENLFNVKLLFEEFSTVAPTDDFEINDIGDLDGDDGTATVGVLLSGIGTYTYSSADDDEEEEGDEDEEEEVEEDDLTEIYNELKGEKAMLVVEDLLDWEDIQEMMEEGVLTQEVVLKSVKSVVKSLHTKNPLQTAVSVPEFKKIVNILEEDLDRMLEDDDEDEEEDSASGIEPGIPGMYTCISRLYCTIQLSAVIIIYLLLYLEKSKVVTMAAADKIPSGKKAVPEVAVEEEDDNDVVEDDDDGDDDSESIFEMLKNKNNKVPIEALLGWGEIKEVIDSKELTLEEFNGFVRDVSNLPANSKKKPTELSKQEFMDLVDLLANKINGDDMNSEQLTEIYNDLKGKDKDLSMQKFREWDEIRDLLAENLVSEDTLKATIEDVCGRKIGQVKTIDAAQFISIVSELEEAMESAEMEKLDLEEEEEEEEEDDDELLRESFEVLRGKKKVVTIQAFKQMEDIKDMLESEYLTPDELDSIIDTVYGKEGTSKLGKTEVDYSTFVKLVAEIDKVAGFDDDEDDDDEEEIELTKEEIAELFDELKDKSGKVPLKTFFAWDSIMDVLNEGSISKEKLDALIDDVCGVQGAAKKSSTKLDSDQFAALTMKVYDEINGSDFIDVEASEDDKNDEEEEVDDDEDDEEVNNDDDDDDEETRNILMEVYDELKDKDGKLSLKSLLNWGDLKEMVSSEIITIEEVKEIVAEVCGKKASNSMIITKDQFLEIVTTIDDVVDDGSDDSSDDDDDSSSDDDDIVSTPGGEDEVVVMSDEEASEEIFNELSKDPKKEKIAMKDFLAWDEIRDLLKNDLIDMETLRILVTEVGAKMNGDLSKKQFTSLLQLVDETTAAMTSEGSGDDDDSLDTDALIKNYSDMEG